MTVRFPIVGMQHHKPAPTIMSLLPAGTALFLELEPQNEHDANAIKVWVENFASLTDQDGIDAVVADCAANEIECPALDQPVFLGYIKAKTIDEEHLGAEDLTPRIRTMLDAGQIGDAKDIPCVLYYGSSGRPALTIINPGDDPAAVLEAPANETPHGDFPDDDGIEADTTDIEQGEPDEDEEGDLTEQELAENESERTSSDD